MLWIYRSVAEVDIKPNGWELPQSYRLFVIPPQPFDPLVVCISGAILASARDFKS
jgi:hypothetical protein